MFNHTNFSTSANSSRKIKYLIVLHGNFNL